MCSRGLVAGLAVLGFVLNHLVFGGMDGGLDLGEVGLVGVEGDHDGAALVTDLVDVHHSVGLPEDRGEVIAARLAGETLNFHRGFVAGDFESVGGHCFLNVGHRHFFGVVFDHDGAGFVAGSALADAGEGTECDRGGSGSAFLLKSGDGELDGGAVASGITGFLACAGGAFAGFGFRFGGLLRLGESAQGDDGSEGNDLFHTHS